MSHLNLTKSLLAFSLLGTITACSSESTVIGNVKVSNVVTSDCKTSVSKKDTRPEYLTDFYSTKTTLSMLMGNDNTVTAQFLDVMDNCTIGQLNVDITCVENKIIIILYPDRDMLTDCVCLYDVNFKIRDLVPGNYQLEIFQTTTNKQTNSSNRIYHGTVTLDSNKIVRLAMTR